MKETRQFKAHPKLLLDVIQRQAGSLGKAILEGVMNAVDAGATKVEITTGPNILVIVDDGHGFRSRREIEEFFEVFGQPQTEAKRYGTFRMGRGQLMSFGVNTWVSGEFRMHVDVANRGFDYDLSVNSPPFPGCKIDIMLYSPLDRAGILALTAEVTQMVRYLDVPVLIDGRQVSRDPAKESWTKSDDVAHYRFNDTGSLNVYNLGVLVRSYAGSTYGTGGHVVSREQLKLNFARNDVMADCPVWQKIVRAVRQHAGTAVKKAASLTDSQRDMLARQIMAGQLADYDKLAIFTDVTGKNWSIDRLKPAWHRFKHRMTVAPRGDLRGDRLMQIHVAFVMSQQTLDRFGLEDLQELLDRVIDPDTHHSRRWIATPYDELAGSVSDHFELIPEKELTPLERAMLATFQTAGYSLARSIADKRTYRQIVLGVAESAHGWTDGKTYIAINREYLQRTGLTISSLISIGQLLLHEYCHDAPDNEAHNHSPEFYELYHNSLEAVPSFVADSLARLDNNLKSQNRQMAKRTAQQIDRVDKIARESRKLQAASETAAARQ